MRSVAARMLRYEPMADRDPVPDHTPGKQVSEDTKAWFYRQCRKGRNPYKVGEQLGISRATVRRLVKAAGSRWVDGDELRPKQVAARIYESAEGKGVEGDLTMAGEFPDPITDPDQLKPKARQAYHELGYWRQRYLHRRTIAWQLEMCQILLNWYQEAQRTNERVRGVVNTPPGGGKTTTVTHDFPGWLISRDRSIRIGLGARTTGQSNKYSRRLRNTLEKNALLNLEFGRFKPLETEVWRQDEFIVDGVTGIAATTEYKLALAGFDYEDPRVQKRLKNPDDEIHEMMKAVESVYLTGEKEATVKALSHEMGFLGGRFDINLWDDLVERKNSRTPELRDSLAEWWDAEAVSRCEPGGVIGLIGTRFGKYDLFRRCRDLTYTAETDLEDELMKHVHGGMSEEQIQAIKEELEQELVDKHGVPYAELEDPESTHSAVDDDGNLDFSNLGKNVRKVYRYVKYPAHDEERCKNPASPKQSDHVQCIIDPMRFKWHDLMRARASDPRRYALTYQQEDESTEENLIQEVWLTGGTDENGLILPGCFNYSRRLMEIPEDLDPSECYSVATVDPSAQNWWSIQWWIWDAERDQDYLINLMRSRLSSDSFLSFSRRQDDYHGVMHQWQIASALAGWPIGVWIIEQSAAQRFLFKHTWVNEWMQETRTQIMGHDTHGNKADEELGVETLRPRYRLGLVDIPYHQDDLKTRAVVDEFKQELTEWPDAETEDMVMGHWFLHFQRYRLPKGLRVSTARRGVRHPYASPDDPGGMPERLQEANRDLYTVKKDLKVVRRGHKAARSRRR